MHKIVEKRNVSKESNDRSGLETVINCYKKDTNIKVDRKTPVMKANAADDKSKLNATKAVSPSSAGNSRTRTANDILNNTHLNEEDTTNLGEQSKDKSKLGIIFQT